MTSESQIPIDPVIAQIADYASRYQIKSEKHYAAARYCLLDALACVFYALPFPECNKLLGPVLPGTTVPHGARVPGTDFILDPIKAAFDITTAMRWLDYNDAWFAAEGAHPSDNLGAILAVSDHVSRERAAAGRRPLTMRDVLGALIKAYEIQGVLALKNGLVEVGLDSVGLLNISATAIATQLLGGSRQEIVNAVSNAWLDGISPRIYRIGRNTGWRKAWASGDVVSRSVMHALFALRGEMGYPAAISAPRWGFSDVLFRGKPIVLDRKLGTFIIENILFKVPSPAQFHTQTAIECAAQLHPLVKDRISDIKSIQLQVHARTIQTAVKEGPLRNAADRDHCLQYVVAITLLHGKLAADDYEDDAASDPPIDKLRSLMEVTENKSFTKDFDDEKKKTNANAMRIEFSDGTRTREVRIDYPLGHPRRRKEALPQLDQKFKRSLEVGFAPKQQRAILEACANLKRLQAMPVHDFMALFVR